MTVHDMDRIMNRLNPEVPLRFVFTQCYSGGFSRLMRPEARDVPELGKANRCGFFAEAEDRESEGCSARIDVGDFRDYSTYFFAALHGRMRSGEQIAINPDWNDDKTVSLYEAHLFALAEAENSDLPRATSEVFLERWQPWYLRWADTGAKPDNIYSRIARHVVKKSGFAESGPSLISDINQQRRALAEEMRHKEEEEDRLRQDSAALRKKITMEIGLQWPEALTPYTSSFVNFLKNDLNAVQDFILAHPDYPGLVSMQDRRIVLAHEEIPALDRQITQLDKIMRLRKLARLLWQFERHASRDERDAYRRLQSCETQPL
jgi:hypothetical protein